MPIWPHCDAPMMSIICWEPHSLRWLQRPLPGLHDGQEELLFLARMLQQQGSGYVQGDGVGCLSSPLNHLTS